jgi:hypothetical protein
MGIFKKIFKGIKKFVKKIGKGIKKVVKKVQKGIGKLGIVGQIGMMFLMPYAMGAMSGFFGQFAAGQAGTWAAKLASSNVFGANALSTVMNAVHSVGSLVGGGVAGLKEGLGNTISGAVDWIAEKTGTTDLVKGARAFIESGRQKGRDLFGKKDVLDSFTVDGIKITGTPKWSTGTGDPSTLLKRGPAQTGGADITTTTPDQLSSTEMHQRQWEAAQTGGADITTTTPDQLSSTELHQRQWEEHQQSLLAADDEPTWQSRAWESAKDKVEDELQSALQARLKGGVSEAILGEQPPHRVIQDVRRNYLDLADNTTGPSLVNGFNDFYAMAGNSWQGSNLLNFDAVKAAGNDGTDDYELAMRGVEYLTLPSQQRVV